MKTKKRAPKNRVKKADNLSTTAFTVGRQEEMEHLRAALDASENVLLEGPVGVGKTHLALAVATTLTDKIYRVDGDNRYSEQKLSGWFDPPAILKGGYSEKTFIAGPLTEAMRAGGILFINELNRLPEGVQNILLPAMDEKLIQVPKLGAIRAKAGFRVIATQNPKEFVATTHLSEALLDRFELITLNYQSEEEERAIVRNALENQYEQTHLIIFLPVRITRLTRKHPRIRRGASIRAAISIAKLAHAFIGQGKPLETALHTATRMALPTRIEIERDTESDRSYQEEMEGIIEELFSDAQMNTTSPEEDELKKKS